MQREANGLHHYHHTLWVPVTVGDTRHGTARHGPVRSGPGTRAQFFLLLLSPRANFTHISESRRRDGASNAAVEIQIGAAPGWFLLRLLRHCHCCCVTLFQNHHNNNNQHQHRNVTTISSRRAGRNQNRPCGPGQLYPDLRRSRD